MISIIDPRELNNVLRPTIYAPSVHAEPSAQRGGADAPPVRRDGSQPEPVRRSEQLDADALYGSHQRW